VDDGQRLADLRNRVAALQDLGANVITTSGDFDRFLPKVLHILLKGNATIIFGA
jgi:hypothetical protein